MAFCKNCGNQIPNDSAFCPGCGTPVDNAQQAAPQQSYDQGYQQNNYQQNNYQQNTYQQNNYQQPYQQPGAMNANGVVSGGERGLAWLAYAIGAPLFLIPLFVKKTSEYCKFHVKQGATLWAVATTYWIFMYIILAIINGIFPGRYSGIYYVTYQHSAVYTVFSIILSLGLVAFGVFAVIGIINAATGKQKELPLFSKIPWVGMLIDKIYAAINK